MPTLKFYVPIDVASDPLFKRIDKACAPFIVETKERHTEVKVQIADITNECVEEVRNKLIKLGFQGIFESP